MFVGPAVRSGRRHVGAGAHSLRQAGV